MNGINATPRELHAVRRKLERRQRTRMVSEAQDGLVTGVWVLALTAIALVAAKMGG